MLIIRWSLYEKSKNNKLSHISSILCYSLASGFIFYALFRFDPMDNNNFDNDHQFGFSRSSFIAALFLAKLSIYAPFLARLYSSFINSYLAPSKLTITIPLLLSLVLFCIVTISFSILEMQWKRNHQTLRIIILDKLYLLSLQRKLNIYCLVGNGIYMKYEGNIW